MAENIKELIEKIQQEGIGVAQEKAKEIEAKAKQKAESILKQAQEKQEQMIVEAKNKITKEEQASRVSLKQASRDLLLSLNKEIQNMLTRVILFEVQKALSPEELSGIIRWLVEECAAKNYSEITISMKKHDLEKVGNTVLKGLKESVSKEVKLKSSEDISGGFLISYDAGKSHFDFTDKALAGYIAVQLKPKLAQILKEAL